MSWIELHDDLLEHYKTEQLADKLGLPKVYVAGHIVSLWLFTLRVAWRNADLSPWGDSGIERAAGWIGEPGKFASAARECGFLDGSVVHGWMERAGKLVKERFRNEKRRTGRICRQSTADLPPKIGRLTTTTVPYRTVPNSTLHNPTVKNRCTIPPPLDAVKAYCLERGNSIDPQYFMDYNEARGWKLGKSKMRDWQATIRTWEKNQSGNRQTGGVKRVVGAAAPVPGKYDHLG